MAVYGAGPYGSGPYGSGPTYSPQPDWGPSPSQAGTAWEAAAQQGGVSPVTRVTVTPPGGEAVELTAETAAVDKTINPGVRMTARVDLSRLPGTDVWALIQTPGAKFTIEHGWHYGGNSRELRPFGVYVLGQAPKSSRGSSISLNLVDQWQSVSECRLTSTYTALAGRTRASVITDLVQAAVPGVSVRVLATGGALRQAFVVDEDRAQGIADLARDGNLLAYFDAAGVFVIAPDPVIDPEATSATFTDGRAATILDLATETVQGPLYNCVVVRPITSGANTQSWSQVKVTISDTAHPRHPSKIGTRPAFYSSPSIGDSTEAGRAGRARLRWLVSETERVEVRTWARGDVEPGQTIATMQDATWADGERAGSWLVEQVEHDLMSTLETKITGRSRADVPTEEE